MWRRLFGIPPPFQGVTAGSTGINDGIEPPSERPPSYQLARLPTKSLLAPRFDTARWTSAAPLHADETGALHFEGLARAHLAIPLGPFSPLFENERVRQANLPRKVDQMLGSIRPHAEVWQLQLGPRTQVNGTASPRCVELSDGDVVEADSERGPWLAWVVRFEGTEPGDTGVGPLWQPLRNGTFTLEGTAGRLQGDRRFPSLEWLRRILASDFAARLTSLDLELTRTDAGTDWNELAIEHHRLAAGAAFQLRLSVPRRKPREERTSAPWVLIPAERHHAPLERVEGGWALSLKGSRFVFAITSEGLALEQKDLALSAVSAWFTPVQLTGVGCVFLPGPSPFLAGQRALVELDAEAVRSFALSLGDDCAAEGLLAIASGAPTAALWLSRLLTPYQRRTVLEGFVSHDDGEHCCGFFTKLRVAPWLDFERDLPVLLAHPLMQHLSSLELFPRAHLAQPPDLGALRRVAERLKPGLQVVLPVLRLKV